MLKITNDMEEISKDNNAIVYFSAEWCGPCKQVKPQFAKAAVIDKDTSYYVVDVDKMDSAWMNKLNIKSIPQIFKMNSGEIDRVIKGRTSQDILAELDNSIEA
jgi:thioredoxin 1